MTQFSPRNLSSLSVAQGFTLWHYRAHEQTRVAAGLVPALPLAEVLSWLWSDPVRPGDMVLISAADGGAQAYVLPGGRLAVMAWATATGALEIGELRVRRQDVVTEVYPCS